MRSERRSSLGEVAVDDGVEHRVQQLAHAAAAEPVPRRELLPKAIQQRRRVPAHRHQPAGADEDVDLREPELGLGHLVGHDHVLVLVGVELGALPPLLDVLHHQRMEIELASQDLDRVRVRRRGADPDEGAVDRGQPVDLVEPFRAQVLDPPIGMADERGHGGRTVIGHGVRSVVRALPLAPNVLK